MTANQQPGPAGTSLLSLPTELLTHICSMVDPTDLARLACTSNALNAVASDESIWASHIADNLPTLPSSPSPAESWRQLYASHHAHWFLPRHRIWYSDNWPYGRLIICRYDPRRGCIEGYTVVAERAVPHSGFLELRDEADELVLYQTFHPNVRLDLNSPAIHLDRNDLSAIKATYLNDTNKALPAQRERPMRIAGDPPTGSPATSLSLVTPLHVDAQFSQTALWPPLHLPSPGSQRARNTSPSNFTSNGNRPVSPRLASTANFRLRQSMRFPGFGPISFDLNRGHLSYRSSNEKVSTYATLDPTAYTPTKEKPWQGIWVGDYSLHGAEFLLVTQPDEPKALPDKARLALKRWPRSRVGFQEGTGLHMDEESSDDSDHDADYRDVLNEPDVAPTSMTAAMSFLDYIGDRSTEPANDSESTPPFGHDRPNPANARHWQDNKPPAAPTEDTAPFRGRLEAIKLTGDPNVPRGEYSFIATDLGAGGYCGLAKDGVFREESAGIYGDDTSSGTTTGSADQGAAPAWRGARMVKSIGHIGEANFAQDAYIPSQLILISEDRLAQWWMPWGHVSFYERVDLSKFFSVE